MMRWLVLSLLLACNGNGNGLHDVKNVGDDIARAGVWYCVSITGGSVNDYPCQDTMRKCETDRSDALNNKYDTGACERFSSAMCFKWTRKDNTGWECFRARPQCEERRRDLYSYGHEVSDCISLPTDSRMRLQRPRQWRTSRRDTT